jgi:hypothetical protein
MATAFHQNTNGQVERANRTIAQMVRIFTNNKQADWSRHLWRVEHAFNHSPSTTIKRTPHEVQFGHIPRILPVEFDSNVPAVNEYLEQQKINNAVARDALLAARHRQASIAAKRRNPKVQLQVGQWVFYKRRSRGKGKVRKLMEVWEGPYRITKVDEDTGNCTLELPKNKRVYPIFAQDKLKLFQRISDKTIPPPPSSYDDEEEDDHTLYNIKEILDHKKINGIDYWYISWENYGPENNSWEPDENVRNTGADSIQEFLSKRTQDYTSTAVTLPPDFFFPSDDSFCSSPMSSIASSVFDLRE